MSDKLMGVAMRRRIFFCVLGGAAVAWTYQVSAQEADRVRRIGVLMPLAASNPEGQARVSAFKKGLEEQGWIDGRNVHIEYRWAAGNVDDIRRYADELSKLNLEAVLAPGSRTVGPLIQVSRSIPIVFVNVVDPVGAGFVASLARPGGNVTGFTQFEYSTSGKWLELLKQIAPKVKRAVVLRDADAPSGMGQFAAIQSAAASVGMEVVPSAIRDPAGIEQGLGTIAQKSNSGMVVTGSPFAVRHRDLIIRLAARHKLPTIYYDRVFVARGGLLSYGPNLQDQYRRAAGYIDRILKGERAADLPVQAATKFVLAINAKTAKALSLSVPTSLLARADEVID